MRYLKDMNLTKKAEAFDSVFCQCLRIHNGSRGEEDTDLDELLTEALGLDGDDAEHVILGDEHTVELKKLVDIQQAILSGDKDELHERCRELADDPDSLQLVRKLVELSLLKWENNQWANGAWSLGSGRGHCPLCARYRYQDTTRRACDPIRWLCGEGCPLASTPCHSDEMLTALGRGDKLHIVENLRAAKARLLAMKEYTPNEVGILLAKESAMQNANVAFNFQNGNLVNVIVKER